MNARTPLPLTVLVIEDDADTSEFLVFLLEASGHNVETAVTGSEGFDRAALPGVDAILLDKRLPDTDGMILCPDLRARVGPTLPIIMMTADSEPDLLVKARKAGATTLLRKPFPRNMLLEALVH